mmetsp:Transcript_51417/g.159440  ORF Transcript_51417/g.159440 Transcript_51417/m.159440 type:complete len:243 (+) Transcript_51417:369-1097(+)
MAAMMRSACSRMSRSLISAACLTTAKSHAFRSWPLLARKVMVDSLVTSWRRRLSPHSRTLSQSARGRKAMPPPTPPSSAEGPSEYHSRSSSRTRVQAYQLEVSEEASSTSFSSEPLRSMPETSAAITGAAPSVPAPASDAASKAAPPASADPSPASPSAPSPAAGRTSRKRNLKAVEPPFAWICSGRSSCSSRRSRSAWLPGAMTKSSWRSGSAHFPPAEMRRHSSLTTSPAGVSWVSFSVL